MQTLDRLLQKKFIGVDELRRELTEILDQLPQKGGKLIITQHGKPKGVLIDLNSYLKIQELEDEIADYDPKLIRRVNTALKDAKKGNTIPANEVWKKLGL